MPPLTIRELEDRLLVLERGRSAHERVTAWGAVIAAIVAVAALVISLLPVGQKEADRATARTAYLEALISVEINGALQALPYAESSSPAAEFANVVKRWRSSLSKAEGVSDATDGSWREVGDGDYELCLPELPVPLFPDECVTISNIDYTSDGKLIAFAIDGIPSGNIVRQAATDGSLTANGVGPVDVFPRVGVVSPDGASTTLIYRIDRRSEPDRQYPVTFSSIAAQNDEEQPLEITASYASPTLGYWSDGNLVVQVPTQMEFLLICWDGVRDARGYCDWVRSSGMK